MPAVAAPIAAHRATPDDLDPAPHVAHRFRLIEQSLPCVHRLSGYPHVQCHLCRTFARQKHAGGRQALLGCLVHRFLCHGMHLQSIPQRCNASASNRLSSFMEISITQSTPCYRCACWPPCRKWPGVALYRATLAAMLTRVSFPRQASLCLTETHSDLLCSA